MLKYRRRGEFVVFFVLTSKLFQPENHKKETCYKRKYLYKIAILFVLLLEDRRGKKPYNNYALGRLLKK